MAEERWTTLGGMEQYFLLRGRSMDAPVMVHLQGGPGMSARAP